MSAIAPAPGIPARRRSGKRAATHLVLIGAVVFTFAPLLCMLGLSLKEPAAVFEHPLRPVTLRPTLASYRDVIDRMNVVRQLVNSVIFAGGVTVLQLLNAIPAAFAFARWVIQGTRVAQPRTQDLSIPFDTQPGPTLDIAPRWATVCAFNLRRPCEIAAVHELTFAHGIRCTSSAGNTSPITRTSSSTGWYSA